MNSYRHPSIRSASCSASHRSARLCPAQFGFTIIELLVSLTIMAIMASMITLSVNAFRPTARQEAGKIAFFLSRAMRKADRWHSSFTLTIASNKASKAEIQIQWDGSKSQPDSLQSLTLSSGFSISSNIRRNQKIRYTLGAFEPSSVILTVKDNYSSSSSHCIVINGSMVTSTQP